MSGAVRVHRVLRETSAEGPGLRFCVWFQGCSRHCPGCFASDTWDPEGGEEITVSRLLRELDAAKRIEGVTVLGGEPFEQPEALFELLSGARERGLSTLVFSGFTIEELEPRWPDILALVDVLVDGEFRESEKSFARPMAGSANQRFHFLTDRYSMADFPPNRIELRIRRDGTVLVNGMGEPLSPGPAR